MKRLFRSETPPPGESTPPPSPAWSEILEAAAAGFERNAGVGGSRSWSARRSGSCFEFSYPEGGAGRRGRQGPRDPAPEQKLFVLRNRQLSGSRDGGGSRAAVAAAQLAGERGWDKGWTGRGWREAVAFAAEGGTGVLGVLKASGAPNLGRGRRAYGGAGVEARKLGAPRGATLAGRGIAGGWRGDTEVGLPGQSGDSGADPQTARASEPQE